MRKRRLLIGAVLAFAIAFLGIGYAAVSNRSLTISGSATADSTAILDVNFTSGQKTAGAEGTTATVTIADNKSQTATVAVAGLDTAGESVTVTLVITNDSTEFNATLDGTLGNNAGYTLTNTNTEYFGVSVTPAQSIAHEATGNCVVVITLLKTPVAEQTATITIGLAYVASALS